MVSRVIAKRASNMHCFLLLLLQLLLVSRTSAHTLRARKLNVINLGIGGRHVVVLSYLG